MKITLSLSLYMLLVSILTNVSAQYDKPSKLVPMLLLDINYAYGLPLMDLSIRFGNHISIGGGLHYQPKSTKWALGFNSAFQFSKNVKEDILKPFRTNYEGLLIGSDGFLSQAALRQRLLHNYIWIGGIYPVHITEKARQGLRFKLGIGYLAHWIKVSDDSRSLTQFNTDYLKGLDRLTAGFTITPSITYEYLQHNGRACFYIGLEPVLAYTKSLRNYHYDLQQADSGSARKDFMFNFKIGWLLPIYKFRKSEEIEY